MHRKPLKAIVLDLSKAFDKLWYMGLQHKLSSFCISGGVFAITQSFLSQRSMKVVVNRRSSEADMNNAGVPQGSLLGLTHFLLCIRDLRRNIHRSLVNLYADYTTVYGCTFKNNDDQNPAADL